MNPFKSFGLRKLAISVLILAMVITPLFAFHSNPVQSFVSKVESMFTGAPVSAGIPADYYFTGSDDNLTLNQMLNALPTYGGMVFLYGGDYDFSATSYRAIDDVTICGVGKATYLENDGVTALISAGSRSGWCFKDFSTDAGGLNIASATDCVILNVWIDDVLTNLPPGGASSGSVFPDNPTSGQQFLHQITGREILYQYDGSIWSAISRIGTMTVYVSPTGTNDLNHGYASGTSAFLTIQYAVNAIPAGGSDNVYINVAAGTYTEQVSVQTKLSGVIYIIGTTTVVHSGVATGGNVGSGATVAQVNGSFSANAYDNYLLKFGLNAASAQGPNYGVTKVVGFTSTTRLYLVGDTLPIAPANNDTYEILGWSTTVAGWVISYSAHVMLEYINMVGGTASAQTYAWYTGTTSLRYCSVTANSSNWVAGVAADFGFSDCFWSVIKIANSGYLIGAASDWCGNLDFEEVRVVGYGKSVGNGPCVRANARATVNMRSCELCNSGEGIVAQAGGYVSIWGTVYTFIHGQGNYGIQAVSGGSVVGEGYVVYGKLLDNSTADTNGSNSYADSATYSFVVS